VLCGECCRAGYEVEIEREDIKKWMKLEKLELLENIIIRPESISTKKRNNIKLREGVLLKKNKKTYSNSYKKVKSLIKFILKTHLYFGKNCLRKNITTIIPNLDYDPLLVPKTFKNMLKGLDHGLKYIIKNDIYGKCPFLKLNLCSINQIKPINCKLFPYTKEGILRNDYPFLAICCGLKKKK
jgi:Fe-S-cluster containining protein